MFYPNILCGVPTPLPPAAVLPAVSLPGRWISLSADRETAECPILRGVFNNLVFYKMTVFTCLLSNYFICHDISLYL